jgi:hypothetical protein
VCDSVQASGRVTAGASSSAGLVSGNSQLFDQVLQATAAELSMRVTGANYLQFQSGSTNLMRLRLVGGDAEITFPSDLPALYPGGWPAGSRLVMYASGTKQLGQGPISLASLNRIVFDDGAAHELFSLRYSGGISEVRVPVGLAALGGGADVVIVPPGNQLGYKSSLAALKSSIAAIAPDAAVRMIERLRPVTFNWRSDGSVSAGFVAEDVARTSERLTVRVDGKPSSYDTGAVLAYAVATIRGLLDRVSALEQAQA